MRPDKAIELLTELRAEAQDPYRLARKPSAGDSWRSRVRAVVVRSLGERNDLVNKLDNTSFTLSMWTDSTPASAWDNAYASGVRSTCGYIDAAVYELNLLSTNDVAIDEGNFDLELWAHVRSIVENEDWVNLPATVAVFTEDKVRMWGGYTHDLVGKGLYAKALGNDGPLRLGAIQGEWEGWRALGMGLAQAVGNVDRHRVQRRDDARRYALGVLGLASLLLTQIRYQHLDVVLATEG